MKLPGGKRPRPELGRRGAARRTPARGAARRNPRRPGQRRPAPGQEGRGNVVSPPRGGSYRPRFPPPGLRGPRIAPPRPPVPRRPGRWLDGRRRPVLKHGPRSRTSPRVYGRARSPDAQRRRTQVGTLRRGAPPAGPEARRGTRAVARPFGPERR